TTTFGPPGAPGQIDLLGDDFDLLNRAAAEVSSRIRQVPGLIDVDTSWRVGRPELQVRVDPLKAASYGLSTCVVAATLRTSIQGATDTKLPAGWPEYD